MYTQEKLDEITYALQVAKSELLDYHNCVLNFLDIKNNNISFNHDKDGYTLLGYVFNFNHSKLKKATVQIKLELRNYTN